MPKFQLDFDLAHPDIELIPPDNIDAIVIAASKLEAILPPSYKWWIMNYAESTWVGIGNALKLFPLLDSDDPSATVVGRTRSWRDWKDCNLKELIVFGMAGVDFETYAFYTGCKNKAGEYPIVWISPGSADGKGYFLLSSRFDRFLNVQLHALKNVSEGDYSQEEYSQLWLELYRQYDPYIDMRTDDFYKAAITTEELQRQADRFCEVNEVAEPHPRPLNSSMEAM